MCLCKKCKFWIASDPNDRAPIEYPEDEDTYELKKMPFEVHECKSTKITRFERSPDITGVSLRDGSDYCVHMYTGEEFGCVNGVEK